jgi:hypothetical protein
MIDYDRDDNDDEMTMMRMTMIVHILMIEYTNASNSIILFILSSYVYHTNDDNW